MIMTDGNLAKRKGLSNLTHSALQYIFKLLVLFVIALARIRTCVNRLKCYQREHYTTTPTFQVKSNSISVYLSHGNVSLSAVKAISCVRGYKRVRTWIEGFGTCCYVNDEWLRQ